jgi:hypothetical protein
VVRRALIAHPHMRLAADLLAERRQEARLADARLARDERDLAFALARLAPAVEEQRHLVLPSDKGRHRLRSRRLEAADVLRLAQNHPGGNRRIEAVEDLWSKRLQLEPAAQQPPRGLCDHDGARPGERLQPRRQIGRLANDGLFLRRPLTDEVANDDDAGGNAVADIQTNACGRIELGDGSRDVETGSNCSFGVVLVGARKAEIGQHAVTHEFGDEAVITCDGPRTGVLIGAYDFAHVLGIKPRRKVRSSRGGHRTSR